MPQILECRKMRHIFAVSKCDTNMQGAKSMQKYNETLLCERGVTILVADIYGVAADQVRKVLPCFSKQVLIPVTTPCDDETFKNPAKNLDILV